MVIHISYVDSVDAFSPQVIQHGAVGEDVIELQARLQYLGFYNSQIDGVFGWGTYWALRNFQYEFGMEVDGLAGDQVKDMLIKASQYHKEEVREQLKQGRRFTHYGSQPAPGTSEPQPKEQNQKEKHSPEQEPTQPEQTGDDTSQPQQTPQEPDVTEETGDNVNQPDPTEQQPESPEEGEDTGGENIDEEEPMEATSANVPNGFSHNDIHLMAQAVYGEARGEPYEGQVAVAAVILNRIQSSTFPDSAASVIFEPLAFTAVADGQIYMEPDETAREAVLDAINGWDPSGEALYYFNPDTATSSWIWSRPQIKRIGKHIFCE
nr:spore cortex-lytic enzyme [Pelagirhabdus alkalitolerans]